MEAIAPPATSDTFSRNVQFATPTSDESAAFNAPPVDPFARFLSKTTSRTETTFRLSTSARPPPSKPSLPVSSERNTAPVDSWKRMPLPLLSRTRQPPTETSRDCQTPIAHSHFPVKEQLGISQ